MAPEPHDKGLIGMTLRQPYEVCDLFAEIPEQTSAPGPAPAFRAESES
jgi:hypothetical protein